VVGLLGLANRPGGFTANDAGLAATFGELAAVALKNSRTRESLEQSETQYRVLSQRLQQLTRQLLTAQEVERRHLARELHDEIGQVLTAVRIRLQIVQHACGAAAVGSEESLNIVDRAIQQVRGMALDLRPSVLDDLGLSAALRWYLDGQAQRSGLTMQLIAPSAGPRPPTDLEIVCYRLTQEAVTNVLRHARARQVEVELLQDAEGLYLTIRDDGVGFDSAAAWQRTADGQCLGLLGMRERVELVGGQFSLDSAPGQGTVVRASFPLSQAEEDRGDADVPGQLAG
jgi:signal transduction histidine kinase